MRTACRRRVELPGSTTQTNAWPASAVSADKGTDNGTASAAAT